ncbi:hypothetical protein JOS77_05975 [Chromobacterium haemolyticum]|nr:hypothetical protein JOS77_05975 [Chromobacterium haemolyticum]
MASGNLSARVDLPPRSGVSQLGVAFNHMADNIAALINSKKTLTNAVAHELRTRWRGCATGWRCWKETKAARSGRRSNATCPPSTNSWKNCCCTRGWTGLKRLLSSAPSTPFPGPRTASPAKPH